MINPLPKHIPEGFVINLTAYKFSICMQMWLFAGKLLRSKSLLCEMDLKLIFGMRMTRLYFLKTVFTVSLLMIVSCGEDSEFSHAVTVEGFVAQISQAPAYRFEEIENSEESDGITRQLMSITVDGLSQGVLVLWPEGMAPDSGWPVVVFNHGFHPDPPNYGRIDGVSVRPGKYYWDSVQAYAENGYAVVVPDYRGHNDSDVQNFSMWYQLLNWFSAKMHGVDKLAYWYTRDSIASYFAIIKMPKVNAERVYMAGHSMGGGITQRSIVALGERIKAASIWSTTADHMALEPYWRNLQVPLLIQHGKEDEVTNADDSKALAYILDHWEKPHRLILVNTDRHLFSGEDFESAVQNDLEWFAQFH